MSNIANAHNGKPLLEVSETVAALKNRSSGRREFIKAAQIEQKTYFESCQEIIGSGLYRYLELVKEKIKIKVRNQSVLDGPSSCPKHGVNNKMLESIHNTVEYFLLPEIVTRFIMKFKNLNYKNAPSFLYGDGKKLPTEHIWTYCLRYVIGVLRINFCCYHSYLLAF